MRYRPFCNNHKEMAQRVFVLKAMSQVATVITSLDDAVTRTITPFKVTKHKIVCFSGSTKCSTKQIGAFYKAPIDLCDK